MDRKLTLSRKDKKIAGVCGGVAEYFGLDSTLLRICVILLGFLFKGPVVVIYIICWAVIPSDYS